MDSVDDEQNAIVAVAIHLRDHVRDPADRQPHAALRMNPGDADDARVRSDLAADMIHDPVGGDAVPRVPHRHLAPRRAIALGGQADRFVVHIVIVVRRQDLIAGFQRQAVIDQRQTRRRVLRHGDVLRIRADVFGERGGHAQGNVGFRRLEQSALDGEEGIRVQLAAVGLDRRADWPWMRREIEEAQVCVGGVEIELLADRVPVVQIGRLDRLDLLILAEKRRNRGQRSGGERTGDQEMTAAERHDRLLLLRCADHKAKTHDTGCRSARLGISRLPAPLAFVPGRDRFFIETRIVSALRHLDKSLTPSGAGLTCRPNNQAIVLDLQFDLVLDSALLENGLRKPDSPGVSYPHQWRPHTSSNCNYNHCLTAAADN